MFLTNLRAFVFFHFVLKNCDCFKSSFVLSEGYFRLFSRNYATWCLFLFLKNKILSHERLSKTTSDTRYSTCHTLITPSLTRTALPEYPTNIPQYLLLLATLMSPQRRRRFSKFRSRIRKSFRAAKRWKSSFRVRRRSATFRVRRIIAQYY